MMSIISINEAVRSARYIVFLTDPDWVSRSVRFRDTSGTLPGGGAITTVGAFDVPCNYEGQLGLRISAQSSPGFGR